MKVSSGDNNRQSVDNIELLIDEEIEKMKQDKKYGLAHDDDLLSVISNGEYEENFNNNSTLLPFKEDLQNGSHMNGVEFLQSNNSGAQIVRKDIKKLSKEKLDVLTIAENALLKTFGVKINKIYNYNNQQHILDAKYINIDGDKFIKSHLIDNVGNIDQLISNLSLLFVHNNFGNSKMKFGIKKKPNCVVVEISIANDNKKKNKDNVFTVNITNKLFTALKKPKNNDRKILLNFLCNLYYDIYLYNMQDRKLENMMVDRNSGDIYHIDVDAMDDAKLLLSNSKKMATITKPKLDFFKQLLVVLDVSDEEKKQMYDVVNCKVRQCIDVQGDFLNAYIKCLQHEASKTDIDMNNINNKSIIYNYIRVRILNILDTMRYVDGLFDNTESKQYKQIFDKIYKNITDNRVTFFNNLTFDKQDRKTLIHTAKIYKSLLKDKNTFLQKNQEDLSLIKNQIDDLKTNHQLSEATAQQIDKLDEQFRDISGKLSKICIDLDTLLNTKKKFEGSDADILKWQKSIDTLRYIIKSHQNKLCQFIKLDQNKLCQCKQQQIFNKEIEDYIQWLEVDISTANKQIEWYQGKINSRQLELANNIDANEFKQRRQSIFNQAVDVVKDIDNLKDNLNKTNQAINRNVRKVIRKKNKNIVMVDVCIQTDDKQNKQNKTSEKCDINNQTKANNNNKIENNCTKNNDKKIVWILQREVNDKLYKKKKINVNYKKSIVNTNILNQNDLSKS